MKTYAIKHKDVDVQKNSQSGGMFTALSDYFLDRNGIVYGCVLSDKLEAIHVGAENSNDRNKMRGSKYVQSHMGDIFRDVKRNLEEERLVLFTGTPCQIAGLKSFLRKDFKTLVCMDIVCHGVPSPKVWQDYLFWKGKQKRSKVVDANFRNKSVFGWNAHVETLYYENGTSENAGIFRDLFYSHLILRPSCFRCPYKSVDRISDITVADCWGIDKAIPEMYDENGVSLVLVNTEKGKQVFDEVRNRLVCSEVDLKEVMQPCLKEPFPKPGNRDLFWDEYSKESFRRIAKSYTEYGQRSRKDRIKEVLKKIIRV